MDIKVDQDLLKSATLISGSKQTAQNYAATIIEQHANSVIRNSIGYGMPVWHLARRDAEQFTQALDHSPQPTADLQKALRNYKKINIKLFNNDSYNTNGFDSGIESVNTLLRSQAKQHYLKDQAVTYVYPSNIGSILGFYTLSFRIVNLHLAHSASKAQYLTVCGSIQIGLDKEHGHNELREQLLMSALHELLNSSNNVPIPAITVEIEGGIPDKFGFTALEDDRKFYIPLSTLKKVFIGDKQLKGR